MLSKKLLILTDETIKNLIRDLIYVYNPNYAICIDAIVLHDVSIYKSNKSFMDTFYPTDLTEDSEQIIVIERLFTNILRMLLPQYNLEVNEVYWHSYLDYRDGEFFTTCYLDLRNATDKALATLWEDLSCITQFDSTHYATKLSYKWQDVSILSTTTIMDYLRTQLKQSTFLSNSELELRMYGMDVDEKQKIHLNFDTPKYFCEIKDFIVQLKRPQSVILEKSAMPESTTYKEMSLSLDYFFENISKALGIPNDKTVLCCDNVLLICEPTQFSHSDITPTDKLLLGGVLNIEIPEDDDFF